MQGHSESDSLFNAQVRNDELMILYTIVNKIWVSPARAIVKQWLMIFRMTDPIECTSLVTRIASNMGILDGNSVPFIEDPRIMIDEAYLVQGHTLKKGPNDSLIFFSLSYANEIPLQMRDITCITVIR